MDSFVLPHPSLSEVVYDAIPVFTDEALFDVCGVRIAFSSRAGGVSTGPYDSLNVGDRVDDRLEAVEQNRRLLTRALVPEIDLVAQKRLIVPRQVHGDEVLSIDSLEDIEGVREQAAVGADGIVVNTSGVAALLCFADCVPVIIVLPTGRFAVVHAGWRGVENMITAKALSLMLDQEEKLQTLSRKELAAGANIYIGPHIHRECFETSEETHHLFVDKFGEACSFDPCHIDLAAALRIQLTQLGVDASRICDIDICTVCHHDRFFSYRAQQGIAGRHGAFAFKA